MIPQWNDFAVLPPIRPGQSGASPDRSPYRVTLSNVVQRFAASPERIRILRGLIAFRQAFSQAVTCDGFQWLNGSFMENKEVLEGRVPNDMDVITFYRMPQGKVQNDLLAENPNLFNRDCLKSNYCVDAYFQQMGISLERDNVKTIAYWHGLWSHRRDGHWKGFVQVELSTREDEAATTLLNQIEEQGASQ